MSPPDAGPVACPMCSAENNRGTARCFLCGQSLWGATEFVPPKPSTGPAAGPRPTFRVISRAYASNCEALFVKFPWISLAEGIQSRSSASYGRTTLETRSDNFAEMPCFQSVASRNRCVSPGVISMMLMIALIAVFLGVFHEAPGLALVLAVPGTIALVRTLAVAGHRPGPPSWFDHVAVFLATFAAVVTVAIAAGVSFFATCLAIVATGSGGENVGAGLIFGAIVGVAVLIGLTVVLVRWSWRRRSR